MDRNTLEEAVLDYFKKVFRKYTGEMTLDTKVKDDLHWKSLQTIAVLARVETGYGKAIPLASATECVTIRDFVDLVESELAQ